MHNGLIREFPLLKRDLLLAVDSSLFASIEGTTDSEAMFYLALTFGLESDPIRAVEQMVGLVEDVARRHGVEHPLQMTIGTSDGSGCGPSGTRARAPRGRSTSARGSPR